MLEIQTRQLTRIIAQLGGMGCKFAIQDPDGKMLTNGLEIAQPPAPKVRKRREFKFPIGTLAKHYKPYIKDIGVGEVLVVPAGEYPTEDMRAAVGSYLSGLWGKGSYTTCIVGTDIQVMREA